MCTVTFLPKERKSFVLTHNRDEYFTRGIAILPYTQLVDNISILAPIDSTANGTWIATSELFSLCLLNGGFVKHQSKPPYRHSRGQIIIDFFKYTNVLDFYQHYNVLNLEPFTLIIIEHDTCALHQLTLNNEKFHSIQLNNSQSHIWSSTTLYTNDDIERRKKHFTSFLEHGDFSKDAILDFHTNKFQPMDSEGIQINRNNILKTVSLTSIDKSKTINMLYKDLIHHKTISLAL